MSFDRNEGAYEMSRCEENTENTGRKGGWWADGEALWLVSNWLVGRLVGVNANKRGPNPAGTAGAAGRHKAGQLAFGI